MRIAILGTRGIPNNYGGFEQFAEYLSRGLLPFGHELFVYSSHNHPYSGKQWEGVNIIHVRNPEGSLGTAGQFVYDLLCILDSRKRAFDVILQLGYTSSSVWGRLLPSRSIIVTNMDGLEWKRTKYSRPVRRFLKYAERLAVKTSHYLVADSKGIQSYLREEYGAPSVYIPYGTHVFDQPDPRRLHTYGVSPYSYNMLIARMEPENNIETILEGVTSSASPQKCLVIGNYGNKYGQYLFKKFGHDNRVVFIGPLYDIDVLNNLRYYSNLYFHGHSVGGTNPSLLEAIGSGALICAHSNEFNRAILEDDAFYFSSGSDITTMLDEGLSKRDHFTKVTGNITRARELYPWEVIVKQYAGFLSEVYAAGKKTVNGK